MALRSRIYIKTETKDSVIVQEKTTTFSSSIETPIPTPIQMALEGESNQKILRELLVNLEPKIASKQEDKPIKEVVKVISLLQVDEKKIEDIRSKKEDKEIPSKEEVEEISSENAAKTPVHSYFLRKRKVNHLIEMESTPLSHFRKRNPPKTVGKSFRGCKSPKLDEWSPSTSAPNMTWPSKIDPNADSQPKMGFSMPPLKSQSHTPAMHCYPIIRYSGTPPLQVTPLEMESKQILGKKAVLVAKHKPSEEPRCTLVRSSTFSLKPAPTSINSNTPTVRKVLNWVGNNSEFGAKVNISVVRTSPDGRYLPVKQFKAWTLKKKTISAEQLMEIPEEDLLFKRGEDINMADYMDVDGFWDPPRSPCLG